MNISTPSNKTVSEVINITNVCAINCTTSIQSDIKIDKLSINRSGYAEEEKHEIFAAALVMKDAGLGGQVYPRNSYKLNLRVKLYCCPEMPLISLRPINENRPFLRVECNPLKLGAEGLSELFNEVLGVLIPYGAEDLYENGKISRVDVAIDLEGVAISDLLVTSANSVRSSKYDRDGRIETLYLGAPTSQAQTKVYDKVAEQIAKGIAPASALPVTRIERTVRNAGKPKNLSGMKNPLSTLRLGLLSPAPKGIAAHKWAMLCAYAREHTAQAALAQLPANERKLFKMAIDSAQPDWWDTKKLWEQWPNVVLKHGFLSSGS